MSRSFFVSLFACTTIVCVTGCDSAPDPIVVVRTHDSGSAEDSSVSVTDAPLDTTADASPEVRDPDANCVKPGTPNNDAGVGGYCETQEDCKKLDGGLCTAKYTDDPTAWFCTLPCDDTSQCGFGAICVADPLGSGCVPLSCAGPQDGGVDGDADASDAD